MGLAVITEPSLTPEIRTTGPVKVFLICPGLGHVNRGFETFTKECFDALKSSATLDLRLFKGAGSVSDARERVLFTLHRTSLGARVAGKILGKGDYGAEAISFGISLLPFLFLERPDIIFFSDWFVGKLLRIWRSMFRFNYRLLLCNGGPFDPKRFCWDHVQQVSPQYLEDAVAANVPLQQQTLLPYGVNIGSEFEPTQEDTRLKLRRQLNLPLDQKIVLCVSAINSEHKRIDYLVKEMARMPEPRPFLMILGQREPGAVAIEKLANELLGPHGFNMRTVTRSEVSLYYQASNLFVLASLREGFGLVFVEALSYGLPCFAHDHPTARFVLGPHGHFGDFSNPGGLSNLILEHQHSYTPQEAQTLYQYARDKFGWPALGPHYLNMLEQVTNVAIYQ